MYSKFYALNSSKFLPVYLLTFVNTLGFSILIPVLPFIIEKYHAPKYAYGIILSLYAFFQFIGAPILGGLSDRIGRKPVLFISQLGTLLSWVIFGSAYFITENIVYIFALPIWIIIISRILDGITGGNISVTNAYVSDITTPKQKSSIFGYLGGIAGVGIIIGPGLGGLAAGTSIGYLGTIILAASISLFTVFAIMFFLKESLPENRRREKERFSLSKTILVTKRIKDINPSFLIKKVLLLRMIMGIMMSAYIGTISLYVVDLFEFNERETGFFMMIVGSYLAFNQLFTYKFFIRKFGELKTMMLGFIFMLVGFFLITLEVNIYLYLSLYYVLNLGFSLVMPTFNSLIAQKGDQNKQGEIMGISESIASLCMAIIPAVASLAYMTIGHSIYYILSASTIIGIFTVRQIIKKEKQHEANERVLEQEVSK